MKQLRPEDVTERFMAENGINKMSGAKCKTDLERTSLNAFAAVKGALDDILLY